MLVVELLVETHGERNFFDDLSDVARGEFHDAVGAFNDKVKIDLELLPSLVGESLALYSDSSLSGPAAARYMQLLNLLLTESEDDALGKVCKIAGDWEAIVGAPEPSLAIHGHVGWWYILGANREISFGGGSIDGTPTSRMKFWVQLRPNPAFGRCETSIPVSHPYRGQPILRSDVKGFIVRVRMERSDRQLYELNPTFSADDAGAGRFSLAVLNAPQFSRGDLWVFWIDPADPPAGDIDVSTLRMSFDVAIDPPLAIEVCWLLTEAPLDLPGMVASASGTSLPILPFMAPYHALKHLLDAYSYSAADLIARRRTLTTDGAAELRVAREYFNALDEMALGAVASDVPSDVASDAAISETTKWYDEVTRQLVNGWWRRAENLLISPPGGSPADPPSVVGSLEGKERADTILAGEHFLKLLSEELKAGRSFNPVERAFVQFASGQLTFDASEEPYLQGLLEPNGILMFCFMELACRMVELGVEPFAWKRLQRIFGQACEIFVRCYHAEDGPRRICAYQPFNNDGQRKPSGLEGSRIRHAWRDAVAEDRFARLVLSALWEEMSESAPRHRMMAIPDIRHVPDPTPA